jgi:hypothetical protein
MVNIILFQMNREYPYCPSVESGTLKPKASIPLKRILSVPEIKEDDKKNTKSSQRLKT